MKLTAKGVIKGRAYVIADSPFVAAIGGASMDVHGAPDKRMRLNDSNPGTVTTTPGGVARNVAENLARLDVDCRLIAAVGQDDYGEALIDQGRAAGIDMRHVLRIGHVKTSTYLSVLDDGGDMLVGVSDMAAIEALDADSLEACDEMLRNAAAIVIDTNLSDSALAYLSGRFADRPIFADTVSTTKALRLAPYLDAVHSLFPSLIEAETLSGIGGSTRAGQKAIAAWFHERGVQRVFITLGRKGVFFSADGEQGVRAPLRTIRAANAGGAGDAFVAGMVAAWLDEQDLDASIEFGLAAASLTLADSATVSASMSCAALRRLTEKHRAA